MQWGKQFLINLSLGLRAELPDVKELSETSIGYAKKFCFIISSLQWIVLLDVFLGDTTNIL